MKKIFVLLTTFAAFHGYASTIYCANGKNFDISTTGIPTDPMQTIKPIIIYDDSTQVQGLNVVTVIRQEYNLTTGTMGSALDEAFEGGITASSQALEIFRKHDKKAKLSFEQSNLNPAIFVHNQAFTHASYPGSVQTIKISRECTLDKSKVLSLNYTQN